MKLFDKLLCAWHGPAGRGGTLGLLASCSKSGEEVQLSTPLFAVGKPVEQHRAAGRLH